jgi:hypothetical protein
MEENKEGKLDVNHDANEILNILRSIKCCCYP